MQSVIFVVIPVSKTIQSDSRQKKGGAQVEQRLWLDDEPVDNTMTEPDDDAEIPEYGRSPPEASNPGKAVEPIRIRLEHFE